MTDDAIILENLSKRFRRFHADRPASVKEVILSGFRKTGVKETFWALRDINFRIGRGKMIGVIGQNGAGKSTLLRLIGKVGKPDAGKIQVNGRIGALLDLTTGFHPDLTGRENVFVSGVICGLTRREVAERLDSIIEFAELEDAIDNPIRTYSTGMQMRLGFAVAIHAEPEILLIDEVLAVGDLAFQQKCLERINRFRNAGCTILLISHDLSQITNFCDEAIWLQSGQVVAHGKPQIVAGEYAARLSSETRRRTPSNIPSIKTSSGMDLRVSENRFGSMEMQIQTVCLLDRAGNPITALASGEPLTVCVEYCAPTQIQEPIFSISISRDNGFVCFDTNTAAQGIKIASVHGRGKICSLGRVDLAGGKYFVDAGIYERNWTHGYDYHWHAYPIEIKAAAGGGILQPPQQWEICASKRVESDGYDDALRPLHRVPLKR